MFENIFYDWCDVTVNQNKIHYSFDPILDKSSSVQVIIIQCLILVLVLRRYMCKIKVTMVYEFRISPQKREISTTY